MAARARRVRGAGRPVPVPANCLPSPRSAGRGSGRGAHPPNFLQRLQVDHPVRCDGHRASQELPGGRPAAREAGLAQRRLGRHVREAGGAAAALGDVVEARGDPSVLPTPSPTARAMPRSTRSFLSSDAMARSTTRERCSERRSAASASCSADWLASRRPGQSTKLLLKGLGDQGFVEAALVISDRSDCTLGGGD